MRKTAVVFSLFGFIVLSSASAQNWLTGSLDDALARAGAAGKPLLIDFFTEVG